MNLIAITLLVTLLAVKYALVSCDVQSIITTIAGNDDVGYKGDNSAATSASLYSPNGVALNSAGKYLYYFISWK